MTSLRERATLTTKYHSEHFPAVVGNVFDDGIEEIAIHCLERIGRLHRKPKPYAVQMDRHGKVVIDRVSDIVPTEWVMTCTRNTTPSDLADELRSEAVRRRPRFTPESHPKIALSAA